MEGKLDEHPLAELIREITATTLTGALRLAQEPGKVAVYFESGQIVFATSNLKAHRLREVVKRNGLTEAHVAEFRVQTTDEEIAAAMIRTGLLKPETLAAIRAKQVSDVLRLALLWTDGSWRFESRVRLAEDTRVQVDVRRLLLECARHLPAAFIAARLAAAGRVKLKAVPHEGTNLLPAELSILSRSSEEVDLNHLAGPADKVTEIDQRAIYALSLAGLLRSTDWPAALTSVPAANISAPARLPAHHKPAAEMKEDQLKDLEALFARLATAKDHYGVLDVARLATLDEIKHAYHALALRFHPDRFHQSDPKLRNRVESAFARIAHAYETLSDQTLRSHYDARRSSKPAGPRAERAGPAKESNGVKQPSARVVTDAARAETSFQHGLDALRLNRPDEAMRFLAEAAMLAPREARYRAHYGYALIRQANTRRIAETELQAALALEPENAGYRVMLAELYQSLGLLKRAEGEAERALRVDAKNEAARLLIQGLRGRSQKS